MTNSHYYNQLCVCDIPLPGIDPDRCYVCGGIIPRAWVRQQRAWQSEMDGTPSGGAIWGVFWVVLVLVAMALIAHIAVIDATHDPTPPTTLAEDITEGR